MHVSGALLAVAQSREQQARTFDEADIADWQVAEAETHILVRFAWRERRVASFFPLRVLRIAVRTPTGRRTVADLPPVADGNEMRRMRHAVVWLLRGKLYAVHEGLRTMDKGESPPATA